MLWLGILVGVALVLLYVLVVRPILVTMPAFSDTFRREATFFEKVQAKITGLKTTLFARLVTIAGVLVGLYDQVLPMVTGQNWTPITKDLPDWVQPVGIIVIGVVVELLRRASDNPPQIVTSVDPATNELKVDAVIQPTLPMPPVAPLDLSDIEPPPPPGGTHP